MSGYRQKGPAFVAELPIAKFHGVGPVTAAKMTNSASIPDST